MSTCTTIAYLGRTDYVVLAHELSLDHRPLTISDGQHNGFRWMTPAELISSGFIRTPRHIFFEGTGNRPPKSDLRWYPFGLRCP